jgi:hypothetical protein
MRVQRTKEINDITGQTDFAKTCLRLRFSKTVTIMRKQSANIHLGTSDMKWISSPRCRIYDCNLPFPEDVQFNSFEM